MIFLLSIAQPTTTSGTIIGWAVALIAALFTGGGFAAMVTAKATRRNLETDSLRKVADATIVLLDPMRAEIERLESRVAKLSDTSDIATRNWEAAEARVRLLTAQAAETNANLERARKLLVDHGIPFP